MMKKPSLINIAFACLCISAFISSRICAQTETKIVADDAVEEDQVGRAICVEGDRVVVTTLASNNYRGCAYVFDRSGMDWTQTAKLISNDIAGGDYFGCSVSMSGDYIVVGAYGDNGADNLTGAAYVFETNGSIWVERAKLTADDADGSIQFGFSVSIDGDYIVVGARAANSDVNESGAAYVFKRDGASWDQQEKLTPDDAAEGDEFGKSVAISGDHIVIGSPMDDDNGSQSGSVYVFQRNDTNWSQQTKLVASDGVSGERFGTSVTIHGNTIAVGTPYDDPNGPGSGSVYIYQYQEMQWNEVAFLTAGDGAERDNFGLSVSICGDYVAVGSYHDDNPGEDAGSAYVFRQQSDTWNQEAKISASDGAAGDDFGFSVSIYGNTIAIGAHQDHNEKGEYAGSAYIYEFDFIPTVYDVPEEYTTITLAMSFAYPGSVVRVDRGVYNESIEMRPGVMLYGTGRPDETVISGNGYSSLIIGAQDAVVGGLTIAGNDNGPRQAGNGLKSRGDNLTVVFCIIRNNRCGIYLDNGSQAVIVNNTIDSNSGCGIFMQVEPSPEIYNNIISNNGDGIDRNTAHSLGDPFIQYNCYYGHSEDYAYYGDPWSPEPGVGEIFQDPLYVGGTPFDYSLTKNSPCIDAGDPSSDIEPDGTIIDMGALWFDQTGIDRYPLMESIPEGFHVHNAYPNPFNSETTIVYELPYPSAVVLSIFDARGRKVMAHSESMITAGKYSIRWDGHDDSGNSLASGIYFCQAVIRSLYSKGLVYSDIQKIILIK